MVTGLSCGQIEPDHNQKDKTGAYSDGAESEGVQRGIRNNTRTKPGTRGGRVQKTKKQGPGAR